MRPIAFIFYIFLLAGCAVPTSVDPLPYYAISPLGARVETAEICRLYVKHGFMVNGSCEDDTWSRAPLSEPELTSTEFKARRNDLQHEILGVATDRCTAFKSRIQKRPRNHVDDGRDNRAVTYG